MHICQQTRSVSVYIQADQYYVLSSSFHDIFVDFSLVAKSCKKWRNKDVVPPLEELTVYREKTNHKQLVVKPLSSDEYRLLQKH